MLHLAHVLGRFEHEVLKLPPDEFARHLAYLTIEAKEEKKAADKARSKVGRR